jgi:glycosyltransferase involved in cell wall biosynthesis
MKSKMTVTVAVSVLNEELNNVPFLEDILRQKCKSFQLQAIRVVSDGSTDKTVKLIQSLRNKKIVLIDSKIRKGKMARINETLKQIHSDVVVILDADIRLEGDMVIESLVAPFLQSGTTAVTSGIAVPFAPVTIPERIAWVSNALWKDILDHNRHARMYRSEGKIRAIHRRLYSVMQFPLASAEDVYPYLSAMQKHFDFAYCKDAIVRYQLPVTWSDYTKQTVRFLQSKDIQANHFPQELLDREYVIGAKEKVVGLFRYFPKNPIWISIYLVALAVPKLIALLPFDDQSGKWDIVISTKKLRGGKR